MSSIQSFLRQRVVGTRTATADFTNAAFGTFYQFIPTGGNYVGNYPPGYMVDNTVDVQNNYGFNFPLEPVMRDMGKTIKAVIGANAATVPTDLYKGAGYFREYQILFPGTTGLNGVAGSNSGVVGGLPSTGLVVPYYYTVYVAIVVNGNVAAQGGGPTAPVFTTANLISDGQL